MSTTPHKLTIQRNMFPPRACDLAKLPFVGSVKAPTGRGKQRTFWCVPEVSCYATANIIGAQYAADFIEYIKHNPDEIGGLLILIAKGMREAPERGDVSHGIEVGFWQIVEKALAHKGGTFDHYGAAEAIAHRIAHLVTDADE